MLKTLLQISMINYQEKWGNKLIISKIMLPLYSLTFLENISWKFYTNSFIAIVTKVWKSFYKFSSRM